jgi:hypothetical protein
MTVSLETNQQRARRLVCAAAERLEAFPNLHAALVQDSRGLFERVAMGRLDNYVLAATVSRAADEQVDSIVIGELCVAVLDAEIARQTKR